MADNPLKKVPIHWLNDHEFCEYKIFLEHVKGIEVEPTPAMVEGTEEHARLEAEFQEAAETMGLDEALELSKTTPVLSREYPVMSAEFGICGRIDELRFTPDEFVVIVVPSLNPSPMN